MDLRSKYEEIREVIEKRIREFRTLWENASERRIFGELAFCLLTPQSKARVCWSAIEKMMESNVLYSGNYEDIVRYLDGVRFKYTKARNILFARDFFTRDGKLEIKETLNSMGEVFKMREYLVKHIRGMGYKEASHFLRNIGLGEDMAILDRHILRNLHALRVIGSIPKSLTRKRYLEIEEKMREYCREMGIPMAHMDLLLWYLATGYVFK